MLIHWKENKILRFILLLTIVVIVFFYFRAFFSTAIYLHDNFLKRELDDVGVHYKGRAEGQDMLVSVTEDEQESRVQVVYSLPNETYRQYTVQFNGGHNQDSEIKHLENQNGEIIYEGAFIDEPLSFAPGGMESNEFFVITYDGGSIYNENYQVPVKHVYEVAQFQHDVLRGNFGFLGIALLLFVFTAIDYKFPLFFFKLEHCLSVRNPEPSELYLDIQRIAWVVLPIVGIIFMMLAI
ncbi:hypothetical protein J2T56_001729 [Natronobacillus azotifigens]|uniref:DUF6199 domain-containing protein n=1 Tax=Natronobacillus azotifigens TaxID=472978 RepID=A0A9J6RCV4_9BACI|nr:hypothetical protein [Natronobacillus azotifigens]MCZ0703528.1 hypothetical protein [Natronobacillus azotifigens]